MAEDFVNGPLCEARRKTFEDRFSRDKERLDKNEENMAEITALNIKFGQIIEQHENKLGVHERRIDSLEKRPSKWIDRIITAAITTTVTTLIAGAIAFIMEGLKV